MRARAFGPVAATCAFAPLLAGAVVLGLASNPSVAVGQSVTTGTPTATPLATQHSLPSGAFLQAITQTPVTPTSTPTPQATATPTVAPTLVVTPVATLSTVSTSAVALATTAPAAVGSPAPLAASLFGTPLPSVASSPAAVSASTSTSSTSAPVAGQPGLNQPVLNQPVADQPGPSGLPPSAIFVPGSAGSAASTDAAAAVPSNQSGPFVQVIDATQGGTLALPDRSLQLAIPGGVADTDFLLVSLTEVGSGSASGNLQVGNREFAMTIVDSGGATVTTFGTPILVTAAGAGGAAIAALDPTSGQFNPIAADAQAGQVTASLDRLAAPATTGVPDAALSIASATSRLGTTSTNTNSNTSTGTSASQPSQQQSSASRDDPAAVLRSLGMTP